MRSARNDVAYSTPSPPPLRRSFALTMTSGTSRAGPLR